MEKAHSANRGAAGLELEGGGMEMIDAPMIKQVCYVAGETAAMLDSHGLQAENVVRIARAAGLPIPDVA